MHENMDYDGAWKEALEVYLRPLVELCFPEAGRGIDWDVPVVFMDKELQRLVRAAKLGKQSVDKLIKVRRREGTEELVLLHLEVQAQLDEQLSKRVYQYHHRIVDRFGQRTSTMVVLADEDPEWRPDSYSEDLWGSRCGSNIRPASCWTSRLNWPDGSLPTILRR